VPLTSDGGVIAVSTVAGDVFLSIVEPFSLAAAGSGGGE